jgi:hypothetical protein
MFSGNMDSCSRILLGLFCRASLEFPTRLAQDLAGALPMIDRGTLSPSVMAAIRASGPPASAREEAAGRRDSRGAQVFFGI